MNNRPLPKGYNPIDTRNMCESCIFFTHISTKSHDYTQPTVGVCAKVIPRLKVNQNDFCSEHIEHDSPTLTN